MPEREKNIKRIEENGYIKEFDGEDFQIATDDQKEKLRQIISDIEYLVKTYVEIAPSYNIISSYGSTTSNGIIMSYPDFIYKENYCTVSSLKGKNCDGTDCASIEVWYNNVKREKIIYRLNYNNGKISFEFYGPSRYKSTEPTIIDFYYGGAQKYKIIYKNIYEKSGYIFSDDEIAGDIENNHILGTKGFHLSQSLNLSVEMQDYLNELITEFEEFKKQFVKYIYNFYKKYGIENFKDSKRDKIKFEKDTCRLFSKYDTTADTKFQKLRKLS